eukprot:COSAG05_NODE_826_length_7102_cov_4.065829_4_plen_64_part_00
MHAEEATQRQIAGTRGYTRVHGGHAGQDTKAKAMTRVKSEFGCWHLATSAFVERTNVISYTCV